MMFDVLYQDERVLIIQTHAGKFDKWGDDVYGSFNMGRHVGDDDERVLGNRATLLNRLNDLTGDKINELYWLNQVHGDIVVDAKATIIPPDADALITDKAGVGLSIMTADCVPIVLFDETGIACIHAGWQGLVKGIIKNTASQFHGKNIRAIIGACISRANYEVGRSLAHDVIQQVVDRRLVALSFDELYQQIVRDKEHDKCLMDLVKLTQLQLAHLNITPMNDQIPCSYDDPRFYSYRQQTHKQKHATGRMAMVVAKLM